MQDSLICLDLSLGSMLEVLVFKNDVECTSQRLKRTSGAQVVTFFCYNFICSSYLSLGSMLERLVPQTDLSVGVLTALVEGNDVCVSCPSTCFWRQLHSFGHFWESAGDLPGSCRGAAGEPWKLRPLSHFRHVTFKNPSVFYTSEITFSNVFTFWHTFLNRNLQFLNVLAICFTF